MSGTLLTLLWSGPAPLPKPFPWLHWWFHILTYRQNTRWENIWKTKVSFVKVIYNIFTKCDLIINEVKIVEAYLLWFFVITTALAITCWRSNGSIFKSPSTRIQTPCFSRFSLENKKRHWEERKIQKREARKLTQRAEMAAWISQSDVTYEKLVNFM